MGLIIGVSIGLVLLAMWSTLKVAASVIFPSAYFHRHTNAVAYPHSFTNALAEVDSNAVKSPLPPTVTATARRKVSLAFLTPGAPRVIIRREFCPQ